MSRGTHLLIIFGPRVCVCMARLLLSDAIFFFSIYTHELCSSHHASTPRERMRMKPQSETKCQPLVQSE